MSVALAAGARDGLRAVAAPIAAISTLGLALAMSLPLFALALEREGVSGTAIGLNAMAAPLAIVLLSPVLPLALARLGLVRLTAGAAALVAVVFGLLPEGHGMVWWTLMRLLWGAGVAALFFAAEFWIVAAAPAGVRGRAIAAYGIVFSAAFAAGPLVLLATGTEGALPFRVAGAIALASLVPLALGARAAPDPSPDAAEDGPRPLFALLRYGRSDPALLCAVLLFGAIEYGTGALFSVWGVRAGLDEGASVTLLAAFAIGSMALMLPLGWAADRFAVRPLLALAAGACVAAPVWLWAAAPSAWLAAPAMLVWGGFGAGLYTLALAGLGARYRGQRLAEAQASVGLAYGLGALAAPALMGGAMDALSPPHGMMAAAAGLAIAYLCLVLVRMRRRP